MMIIDKGARYKLIQALKSLANTDGKHCLCIHSIHENKEQLYQRVILKAQRYVPNADLYFDEDGEIFLFTRTESTKECRKIMWEIAVAFNIQPAHLVGELYDLAVQKLALVLLLEKKVEQDQKRQEVLQKQQALASEAARLLRKRQEILEQSVYRSPEQIAEQREQRNEPEFMIIEDDPFSRRLVLNALQKQYRLTELGSAEEALSTYATLAPDILFLDINLPDITGHELLEKITALDPQAYVVMLSGNADKKNVMQAIEKGAVGFVAKPFSRDRLFQYIDRCPTINKVKA